MTDDAGSDGGSPTSGGRNPLGPTDPPETDDGPGTDPTSRSASDVATDALVWARAQLSVDGVRRLLRRVARLLRLVRPLGSLVLLLGVVGVAAGIWLFTREPTPGLIVAALSLPALVAPVIARRRLEQLAVTLEHPDRVVAQARDLADGLRPTPEVRELLDRVRTRESTEAGAGRRRRSGRLRRTIAAVRAVSGVVDIARPDPERHPLLAPLTPGRLRGLWSGLVWSVTGAALASIAIVAALLIALLRLF